MSAELSIKWGDYSTLCLYNADANRKLLSF